MTTPLPRQRLSVTEDASKTPRTERMLTAMRGSDSRASMKKIITTPGKSRLTEGTVTQADNTHG